MTTLVVPTGKTEVLSCFLQSPNSHSLTVYVDHYAYGAGRRVCPGIHLAERSLWRITAKFLWAFEFDEPIDKSTGKTRPLDDNAYTNGFLHMPLPFEVQVKVRSEAHLRTIKQELAAAKTELQSYQ